MRAQRKGDPELARGLRMERASLLLDKLKDVESALVVAQGFASEDPAAAERCTCGRWTANRKMRWPWRHWLSYAAARRVRAPAKFALEGADSQEPDGEGAPAGPGGAQVLDHLDDQDAGRDLLERALAADPEQVSAAARLAQLREARQEWVPLEPVLDMLLRRASAQVMPLARSARTGRSLREAVGKDGQGAGQLRGGHSVCPPHSLSLAQGLGRLAFRGARRGPRPRARARLCPWAGPAWRHGTGGPLPCAWPPVRRRSVTARSCFTSRRGGGLEPHQRSHMDALIGLRTARQDWREVADLRRKATRPGQRRGGAGATLGRAGRHPARQAG